MLAGGAVPLCEMNIQSRQMAGYRDDLLTVNLWPRLEMFTQMYAAGPGREKSPPETRNWTESDPLPPKVGRYSVIPGYDTELFYFLYENKIFLGS